MHRSITRPEAPPDVLFAGAGPTGLGLSPRLDAAGARIRLADRQLDRARESRALGTLPRTLEIQRSLGITQQLVARGNRAVKLLMHKQTN